MTDELQSHAALTLSEDETQFIKDAAQYLENPSLLMEIASIVGKPLEFLFHGLEAIAPDRANKVARAALMTALEAAIATIRDAPDSGEDGPTDDSVANVGRSTDWWHKLSVAVTGGAGGLFGWAGLAVELPLTTTIMLRSIAATAQEFGENLDDMQARLQCLTVFAYGGPDDKDDAMESSYLTARCGLQAMVQEAAAFVAKAGADEFAAMIERGAAPVLVRLITTVAARFNIVVTEKIAGQTIPVLGALFGAAINVAFVGHFNRVARFHFGLRQLERKYGLERIQCLFRETVRVIKNAPDPAPFRRITAESEG